MPNSTLTFHNTRFNVIDRNGQSWLTSAEIAQALEYADSKAVSQLYASNSDEFTPAMTQVVESTTSGNLKKSTRIFSLRGAHLIGMFARTPIAKEFRQWILDVLDKEVRSPKLGSEVQLPSPYYLPPPGKAFPPRVSGGILHVYRLPWAGKTIRAFRADCTLWFSAEDLKSAFSYQSMGIMLAGMDRTDLRLAVVDGKERGFVSLYGLPILARKRCRSTRPIKDWLADTVLPKVMDELHRVDYIDASQPLTDWATVNRVRHPKEERTDASCAPTVYPAVLEPAFPQPVNVANKETLPRIEEALPPTVDAPLPITENPVFSTQAVDCCYVPSLKKSLFQVKPGIDAVFALEEAQSLVAGTQNMLYNYPDHEQAAHSAGYMMYFVEGLIRSVQMSLCQV